MDQSYNKLGPFDIFCIAVIIVFLLGFIYWIIHTSIFGKRKAIFDWSENMEGRIYTSGADLRDWGPQFTSTDQDLSSNPGYSEHLVNERGEPDFWEINPTLNAFREQQIPGYLV
jgi:hypothetical protein